MASSSPEAISDYKLFLHMQLHKREEYKAKSLNAEGVKTENFVGDAFPKKTVAFAKVEVRSGDTIESTWIREERKGPNGLHAEMALLEKFDEIFKSDKERLVVRIVIYQNYSPCEKCSPEISKFCDKTRWRIEFVFVALHNIIRPSCTYRNATPGELEQQKQRQNQQERKCKHSLDGLPLKKADSDVNIKSLYKLQESRVSVRTFTREDWLILRDYLLQPSQNYLGFFYFELGKSAEWYNCLAESRQEEDEHMQRDLTEILERECLKSLEQMSVSEQA